MTTSSMTKNFTTDYLGKSYVWALYNMLPSFGFFKIEVVDTENGKIYESLEFSKNTDEKEGYKDLKALLNRHPDSYRRLETQFDFGFGFDLFIKVYL